MSHILIHHSRHYSRPPSRLLFSSFCVGAVRKWERTLGQNSQGGQRQSSIVCIRKLIEFHESNTGGPYLNILLVGVGGVGGMGWDGMGGEGEADRLFLKDS